MTVVSVPDRIPTPMGHDHVHGRPARWAVGLAAVVAVATVTSFATFAIAYAIGGSGATEDNWVGFVAGVAMLGGLPTSLVAFLLAIVAKVRHERWALLWLPLLMFPGLLAFLVLGEAFWWE